MLSVKGLTIYHFWLLIKTNSKLVSSQLMLHLFQILKFLLFRNFSF